VLDRAAARSELGLPLHERLIVYTGHVGPDKGMEALIRTAAGLPNARMVIVGAETPSEYERIETLAREADARNVIIRPRVPVADVSTYLYAADCLIVPPTDEPLRGGGTVLPMKIFGYLAAGRPILAPRLPDVEEVLTDGKTALLVAPQNFAEAARVLADLFDDEKLQQNLAQHARSAAFEYTWEARARRVFDFLSRVERPIQRDARRSAAAAAASSRL
jgi:glycosyltransferase involved in cell wall biosynthesis